MARRRRRSSARRPGATRPRGGAWAALWIGTALLLSVAAGKILWTRTEALAGTTAVLVDPARVRITRWPEWFEGPTARALFHDLMRRRGAPFALLDEAGAEALAARWRASPWVRRLELECVFPDRFRIHAELREPEAWIADPQGRPRWVDRDGLVMPRPDVPLEQEVEFFQSWPRLLAADAPRLTEGAIAEPACTSAARVAAEWRTAVAAVVGDAPRLLAVDATNFEYRLRREPESAEFRLVVLASDGREVRLEWGHAPDCRRWRVLPTEVKVEVLRKLLDRHPGLAGVERADLRARNRWADWIRLRAAPTAGGAPPAAAVGSEPLQR